MIRVCSLLLLILQHVYLFVCNRDNVLFDSVIYLITVFFFFWVSFGVWLSCYWVLGLLVSMQLYSSSVFCWIRSIPYNFFVANLGFCFVAKAWTLGLGLGSMVCYGSVNGWKKWDLPNVHLGCYLILFYFQLDWKCRFVM